MFNNFHIFLFWVSLSFLIGLWAERYGRSFWGFLALSLILSPLIGAIAVLTYGKDEQMIEKNRLREGYLKKCPDCAELIKKEAKICKFCRKSYSSK